MRLETMYYGIDVEATGQNIARLRKAAGLSVRDIQAAMGFTAPNAVYKWERGKSIPALEHLMVLSKLFGVKMEDILIWSRPPPINS